MDTDKAPHVFEILCNTQCNRRCPGCNQGAFMKYDPKYEYTPEDAQILIDKLNTYNKKTALCFTGGEPALWTKLVDVMNIFNKSDRITRNWVVTSELTESNIKFLKEHFQHICGSIRENTKQFLTDKPDWLADCTLWNQTAHTIFSPENTAHSINCCCSSQGIRASLIHTDVYPCVLAKSLQLDGFWPDLAASSLDDYFKTNGCTIRIGRYNACYSCVNNINVRRINKTQKTY